MSWHRLVATLTVVAALLSPVMLIRTWLPVADDLDVPHWDQWEMVPLLEASTTGTLSLVELLRQDGETRPLVPRSVLLALAFATGWDTRAEVALNLVVGGATLAGLIGLLWLTVRPTSPMLVPPLALAASAISFSLAAYEAWLWGWSLVTVTSAACAVFAALMLGWRGRRAPAPALAALAAAVAAFSFTNGLLLLGLVPLALLLDPRPYRAPAERRAPFVAGAITGLAAVVYFAGFAYPRALSVSDTATHPAAALGFSLVYLGAPFGALSTPVSAVAGACGLAVGSAGAMWLWRRRPARRAAIFPWLMLSVFAVLAAALASVGRWRFGVDHALTSRYQTFAALFWMTVFVVAALAAREGAAGSPRRRILVGATAGLLACFAAAGAIQTWLVAREPVRTRVEALRRGRECVVFHAIAPAPCLALIYPDPAVVRHRAAQLEALGLGPFRARARPPALDRLTVSGDPRPVGAIESVSVGPALLVNPVSAAYHAREVVISGRAIDPATARPAREVIIVVDGRVAGRTQAGPDGFTFRFGTFRLGPGPHSIEGWARLNDGGIARLARGFTIVAPPATASAGR